MPTPTSFYHLSFMVEPGGARMDAHFVRGTLDEIRRDLEEQLEIGVNLYLLCWYGAHLDLDVYQRGTLARQLDVHPYITIEIEGYPTITFDKDKKVIGYDFHSAVERGADDGTLASKLFGNELADKTRVTIAWERMELPALEEPIVKEGEYVTLEDLWDKYEDDVDEQDLLDDGWLPVGFVDKES